MKISSALQWLENLSWEHGVVEDGVDEAAGRYISTEESEDQYAEETGA